MLNNKNFYIKSLSADPKWFKVRPEAVAYNKRDLKEKNMLKFITENFAVFYPKEGNLDLIISNLLSQNNHKTIYPWIDESRNVSSDIDMSKHRKVNLTKNKYLRQLILNFPFNLHYWKIVKLTFFFNKNIFYEFYRWPTINQRIALREKQPFFIKTLLNMIYDLFPFG